MGYLIYGEAKKYAPTDLDAAELALLLILASEANEDTRECQPGADELCAWMRMSRDGVSRILQRLAARGLDVRVALGTDSAGRKFYAHKGMRTTYRLPRFGPEGGTESQHSQASDPHEHAGRSRFPTQTPGLSMVYVLGSEGTRRVKIGKADSVAKRVPRLQTGSPERLDVLMTIRGGMALESALHDRFSAFRAQGEWFDFGALDPLAEICDAVGAILRARRQSGSP